MRHSIMNFMERYASFIVIITGIVVILLCVVNLVGCTVVPKLDEQGQPIVDADGIPETDVKFDPEKAQGAAATAAAFLPPPWNAIAAAGLSTAVLIGGTYQNRKRLRAEAVQGAK